MRALDQNRCMMSALDTRVSRAPAAAGVASKFVAAVHDWMSVRATRKALNRLSDRELDDIGLCRADIDRVARGF